MNITRKDKKYIKNMKIYLYSKKIKQLIDNQDKLNLSDNLRSTLKKVKQHGGSQSALFRDGFETALSESATFQDGYNRGISYIKEKALQNNAKLAHQYTELPMHPYPGREPPMQNYQEMPSRNYQEYPGREPPMQYQEYPGSCHKFKYQIARG